MSTLVLVHGMSLGGWCWNRVAGPLRKAGHDVYTPTLTGLGDRSHLLNRKINLETHIEDVVNLMKWEDLKDVILVGHSYGGSVVTGVADRETQRIHKLVYLDAFIPKNGESVMDLQPPHRVAYYKDVVAEKGKGWLVPPNPAELYGVTDSDDQAWIDNYSVPQPFSTLDQALILENQAKERPYSNVFIWASNFMPSPFVQFAQRCRSDPAWDYHEVPSGHMVMMSNAEDLVSILDSL